MTTSLGVHGAHLDPAACLVTRALIRHALATLAAAGQRPPPGTAAVVAALDPAADAAFDAATSPLSPSVSSGGGPWLGGAECSWDTTASVAERLGVSRRQVNRLVAAGVLRGVGGGRGAVQRIDPDSVAAYERSRSRGPHADT